ncbi:hypothetical protein [Psychrobacter jeotgali]|nr:hypothetical protein [Psychrobacter jeotgali]
MEPSTFIGSSIFLYIIGFILIMVIGGYLTYRSGVLSKRRREEKRDKRR